MVKAIQIFSVSGNFYVFLAALSSFPDRVIASLVQELQTFSSVSALLMDIHLVLGHVTNLLPVSQLFI